VKINKTTLETFANNKGQSGKSLALMKEPPDPSSRAVQV